MARLLGLGSVYGKSLRDARRPMLAVAGILSLLVVVTIAAIGAEFDTAQERAALARQMELLPAFFQGLIGRAIELETLPGFLSWRLVNVLPLMVGLWSIVALSGTLAGEAANGTLEMVAALPISRRRIAAQKYLAHATALGIALAIVAVAAWAGTIGFATLPGDETTLLTSLGEFGLVFCVALLAGTLALVASLVFGRGLGAGLAGAYLFGGYAINGYATLVPGFDVARLGTIFYWTQGHRPLAGAYDWPALVAVAVVTLALAVLGVVLFVRRDLGARTAVRTSVSVRGHRLGLPLGGLLGGSWSLRGPGRRALADRLPEAIGWGTAMGAYGLVVAFSRDTFKQVFESLPQIAQMVRTIYPEFSFDSVGSVLQFAIFAFIALIVGLAAASLVNGWASDERQGRLEVLLSSPVARATWALRSGGALLLALLVMGLFIGLGPWIGAASQGQVSFDLIGGGLVLGLYGAALAGIGVLVGGLGRPGWAALAVGAATLGFYLLDLLGAILKLPAEVINLSLSHHLGRPMAGVYDIPGMVACAAIALCGLVLGALAFSRRDLRAA